MPKTKSYKHLPFLGPIIHRPRLAFCCALSIYVSILALMVVLIMVLGEEFFPFSSEVCLRHE